MDLLNNLSNKNILTLHTQAAIQHFSGDWKTRKVYLTQFANMLSRLWEAIKQDDPYAEFFLYRTYDQIQAAMEVISKAEQEATQVLNKIIGMEIQIYTNTAPFKKELHFKTPYAFMGARLLLKVDDTLRLLLTMRKFGIPETTTCNYQNILNELRKTFVIPRQWQKTGVTRLDVVGNTEKAQRAFSVMGELPMVILEKQLQFPFKPQAKMNTHI
ncbi:MAG: hypothetical protein K0S08_674 [Gammaproteobacteria bacterium]|jgi:integrating conjugative element protein (TIGR03761 family)|nr:hypothetical protein [Gammaproteobacteria bacterium]